MRRQRGDTLIEVLLSVTIFSMLAVGTMAVMNRGVAIAQQSLEITQVRQQIDAQAEMLRFVHDMRTTPHYAELWSLLLTTHLATAAQERLNTTSCPESFVDSKEFALMSQQGTIKKVTSYQPAVTYAKVADGTAYGIAVRLVKNSGRDGAHKYDAYIQACWQGPMGNRPATLGTIVRLYDAEA